MKFLQCAVALGAAAGCLSSADARSHGQLRQASKLTSSSNRAKADPEAEEEEESGGFVTPEGGIPVTQAQQVVWDGVSKIPKSVQLVFAFSWIGLLGAIPLVLRYLGKKPVTKTEMTLSAALWVTLFGGLYLFTNIILFQSGHFKQVRPLTIIECIYLMSQVITTVGYGDITPAKPRGQVFVGLYVLGALFVISFLISQLTSSIARAHAEYQYRLKHQAPEGDGAAAEQALVRDGAVSLSHVVGKPPAPDKQPLLKALAIFAALDVVFVLFFYVWPGEGKTLMQALYMSVITLSTVGFGAFTPVTEGGMIFGAFMMLFGSAALVNAVGAFAELCLKSQAYEQFSAETAEEALSKLENNDWGGKEGAKLVSEMEFLCFGLVSQGLVTDDEITAIRGAFSALKPQNGCVPIGTIRAGVQRELEQDAK
eukprot:TRINITY_DN13327_c0_g1_i1.p1 TRINITY_DN13327_c0_g1~~TRINITY_DN13327_c0_g1_i1.p1  ORF type:complete len:450 (-),score=119.32 TRINITY_DN13327_c0_g1_i1:149-1423(-)